MKERITNKRDVLENKIQKSTVQNIEDYFQ